VLWLISAPIARVAMVVVAACAIAAGIAWVLVEPTPEGVVYLALNAEHGLTAGDLPGVAAVLLGVVTVGLAWALRRDRTGERLAPMDIHALTSGRAVTESPG